MTPKKLIEKMKNEPLRYPYCDWRWLRSLPADIMHYIAFDFADPMHPNYAAAAELLGSDFLAEHIPEFLWQRWFAAKRYVEWEREYTQNGTKRMGIPIDKALRSKMRNGTRYFSVPTEKIEHITNLMDMSAHFLLFGEEQPFLLPEPANAIVKRLARMDEEVKIRLAAGARVQERAFIKGLDKEEMPEGHFHATINELYRSRMSWYMDNERLRSPFVFGVGKTPNQLKTALPKIFNRDENSVSPLYEPQLQLLCETALITQFPLDFFVCSNFSTKRIKCLYKDDEGKEHEITDLNIRSFLEGLFTISEPYREVLLTKTWEMILQEEF